MLVQGKDNLRVGNKTSKALQYISVGVLLLTGKGRGADKDQAVVAKAFHSGVAALWI